MSDLLEEMKKDALEAQRFSRKHLVLELDFSLSSIKELESHVGSIDYAISGGKSDENIAMLTRVWGAYLGEAIRKKAGGEWKRDDEGKISLQLEDRSIHPHARVRECVTEGDGNGLADFYSENVESASS